MNTIQGSGFSIEQMAGQYLSKDKRVINDNVTQSIASFGEILKKQTEIANDVELKFSKHANERLATRNIDLSEQQIERLEGAVKKAGEKGIKESLVMIDSVAFIVNVTNNTVVTAVGDSEERIFTNIDGAIIA